MWLQRFLGVGRDNDSRHHRSCPLRGGLPTSTLYLNESDGLGLLWWTELEPGTKQSEGKGTSETSETSSSRAGRHSLEDERISYRCVTMKCFQGVADVESGDLMRISRCAPPFFGGTNSVLCDAAEPRFKVRSCCTCWRSKQMDTHLKQLQNALCFPFDLVLQVSGSAQLLCLFPQSKQACRSFVFCSNTKA